jgi:hypothetical protein
MAAEVLRRDRARDRLWAAPARALEVWLNGHPTERAARHLQKRFPPGESESIVLGLI